MPFHTLNPSYSDSVWGTFGGSAPGLLFASDKVSAGFRKIRKSLAGELTNVYGRNWMGIGEEDWSRVKRGISVGG